MAKIKSTIDLIMEKTKHLSLNDEEKQALERQKLLQRMQASLVRDLKGERDANFLAHELHRLPPEKRDEAKRIFLELMRDRLSPFEDNTRILAGVETLQSGTERKRWEETLAPLEEQLKEELERARAEAVARSREALAAAGLRGSAILPCIDDHDTSWKKELEERINAFRQSVRTRLNGHQR